LTKSFYANKIGSISLSKQPEEERRIDHVEEKIAATAYIVGNLFGFSACQLYATTPVVYICSS
jgi:hypothetical protein